MTDPALEAALSWLLLTVLFDHGDSATRDAAWRWRQRMVSGDRGEGKTPPIPLTDVGVRPCASNGSILLPLLEIRR